MSKSGKVPPLKLGAGTKKFLFIGVGLVVAGILLYVGVNMFGSYFDLLPTSEIWFWPAVAAVVILVTLVAFKGTRKGALAVLYPVVAIAFATVVGTSGGLLIGSSNAPESVCGSQHRKVVLENKPLTVTLCSVKSAEANSISVYRNGPREVTIKLADDMTQKYGDRLKGSSPSDFYVKREPGHMGSNFFFELIPNSDTFDALGISHIPLDFVIEYKDMDIPTR